MKVNFKINTLRGIFLCLTRNKDSPCPRTVFSQTQKTKNVCLKRRFQFVGRSYKLKTPPLLPGKSSPIFTLRFAPGRPCSPTAESRPARASLRFKKANTFPSALGSTWPGGIENHFCKGAKMFNQSFRLGLLRRNGSDQHN